MSARSKAFKSLATATSELSSIAFDSVRHPLLPESPRRDCVCRAVWISGELEDEDEVRAKSAVEISRGQGEAADGRIHRECEGKRSEGEAEDQGCNCFVSGGKARGRNDHAALGTFMMKNCEPFVLSLGGVVVSARMV
ncbi:hypothetical protein B0H13DRAFT_1913329 [Mycena leptocephala]|nr:hypothetical protein B0H13DRAFT_1913329 [Mycena leptocephala]